MPGEGTLRPRFWLAHRMPARQCAPSPGSVVSPANWVSICLCPRLRTQGRIIKEDVQAYVKRTPVRGQTSRGAFCRRRLQLPAMPAVDFSKFGEIEEKELGRIKAQWRPSAPQLAQCAARHASSMKADITELEGFRKAQKDEAARPRSS